ncbi:MAG: hypothetical protein ACLFUF_05675 [Opitutales bacterium]
MDRAPKSESTAEPRKWTPDDFTMPPVISRRFRTNLECSRDEFEKKGPDLIEAIRKEGHFDQRAMKEQWDFRLEIRDKTPRPKVLMTHIPVLVRFAKSDSPKTVVEMHPQIGENHAQLLIAQDRTDESPSRFEDLEKECKELLPRVLHHFGMKGIRGFVLEYRNLIARERYPIFWEGENTLELGRLLRLFQSHADFGKYVTPFSVEFNTATPLSGPGTIRFEMSTVPQEKKDFALGVNLSYNSLAKKDPESCDVVFQELADAHDLLFKDFVRHFSPEALSTFTQ